MFILCSTNFTLLPLQQMHVWPILPAPHGTSPALGATKSTDCRLVVPCCESHAPRQGLLRLWDAGVPAWLSFAVATPAARHARN